MLTKALDKTFSKLPTWAKVIWMALTIALSVFCIAHYGWSFILHTIFSP